MDPESQQHAFGGGGQSAFQVVTFGVLLLAALLLFLLPRKYAVLPFLIAATIIPLNQQAVVAGLHITMSRVLICLGWLRLVATPVPGGLLQGRWNRVDIAFVFYSLQAAVAFVILWGGESGAFVNKLGFLYNALGTYWLVRCFVRSDEDIQLVSRGLVWLFVVIAAGMLIQQIKGVNVFAQLGGVPESSDIRNGRVRSQGPFVHPLTAGAIGSALLPLAVGLWFVDGRAKKRRWAAAIGTVSCIAVGITSSSSTALLTLVAGAFAIFFWPLRAYARTFRVGALLILISLHLTMKAPVWALIARIDLTGSSSGYHRYQLVDQFIRRFSEWWFVGTRSTMDWGWDMWDTINSYVTAGTKGGFVTFCAFVAVLAVAFQQLGLRRRVDPGHARQYWILGSMLFAQSVAFFGIEYFDQSQFVWYALLAMVSAATSIPFSSDGLEPMGRRVPFGGPAAKEQWWGVDEKTTTDSVFALQCNDCRQ